MSLFIVKNWSCGKICSRFRFTSIKSEGLKKYISVYSEQRTQQKGRGGFAGNLEFLIHNDIYQSIKNLHKEFMTQICQSKFSVNKNVI